ncbi:MAG: glycosyltransferase family 39 protein [Chitinispirillaceae bacterium]|nr:glycosyltransferase family 39 protein [Chitinispirillaceae bacterium]
MRYLSNNPVKTTAVISILLNLIILSAYRQSPFATFLLWDAAHYWDWALKIADGQWIGNTVFHQPPLYPYLLAAFIKIFGQTLTPVYLFQSVLSAGTAALVAHLTGRVTGSNRTGLVAGMLYAFYGMQLFYAFKVLSECVAAFLLVLVVWLLLSEHNRLRTFAAGASMGAVLLVKPNFLLAVPFLAVFFFIRKPDLPFAVKSRQTLGFLITCAVLVFPATVLNYIAAKEFVLVSVNGGENFYLGNNERANGTYVPIKGISGDIAFQNADVVSAAQWKNSGKSMSRAEVSQFWFRKAVAWITDHPVDYLRLEWTKFLNMFSGVELSNQYLLSFEKNRTTGMFNAAPVNFYLLFPLFCTGCIATAIYLKRFFPLIVLLGVNYITMMIFFVDERFRVITMPFFIAISAAGAVNIVTSVLRRKGATHSIEKPQLIVVVAGLLLLAGIYTRDRRFPGQEWRMEMALGDICYGKGEIDTALDYYVKASSLNKTNCMPAFMVSKAMFAKGYRDVAAQLYRNTIRTVSDDERKTILRDPDFNDLRRYVERVE